MADHQPGYLLPTMKALVSWEDDSGTTHRWELVYDDYDL